MNKEQLHLLSGNSSEGRYFRYSHAQEVDGPPPAYNHSAQFNNPTSLSQRVSGTWLVGTWANE